MECVDKKNTTNLPDKKIRFLATREYHFTSHREEIGVGVAVKVHEVKNKSAGLVFFGAEGHRLAQHDVTP